MARVSALRRGCFVCSLLARCFLGDTHVPLSPRRPYLHYPVVFTWRLPLVPMGLRRDASHALPGSFTGRNAGGGNLVVREQSSFPLVRCDRTGHSILHDPEGDRTSGL